MMSRTERTMSYSDSQGPKERVNGSEWERGAEDEEEDEEEKERERERERERGPPLDGATAAAEQNHLDLELCINPDAFGFSLGSEAAVRYLGPEYSEGDSSPVSFEKRRTRSSSSRHRYDTVTELGPEEIRWFYKEDKKIWKSFIGYDSLRIELEYRRCRELLDPDPDPGTGGDQAAAPEGGDGAESQTYDSEMVSLTIDPVCVRGGLYEVDVKEKECYPVYWNQMDKIPVMRSQWFIDGTWQPLEEEDSDLIEQEHLTCFRGQQIQDNFDMEVAQPVDRKDAVHSLKLSRSHVDWYCVDEVYLYSDATTSKIARTVTQKLGFSKASSSGTRLHRGYVEEATLEDKPPQPTHVVFVVHGIGQKMDQGRIIKNTGMLRDTARKMEEKHFSDRVAEHVEFLPVEWRSKLPLDGDTVDSITPDKVRGLRDMLNSSAMDIMYYTSPLYRDQLVKGLQQELNRLYILFCSRNPEFEEKGGKVSIVSHSLGCVITYDIMTGWNPIRLYEQLMQEDDDEVEERWMSYEKQHLLNELRSTKQRLKELEERLHGLEATVVAKQPALKFKAYRLEPLILKHYSNIAPVQIHWYNTINRTPYHQVKPVFLNMAKETTSISDTESIPSPSTSPVIPRRHYGESITNIGKASILGAASIGKGLGGMLFSRFARSSAVPQSSEATKDGTDVEDKKSVVSQSSLGLQALSPINTGLLDTAVELEHRIDFELREGLVESRYWSAVTSHTAYWSSLDVALFLLSFMYKKDQLENENESPEPL
ncbi:phospholipase DDHD1b isoform X2 [Latimeria chalumnae]|uniref:phospholipase DDHD1b isoform X2 n=1 Tax=Latimeria chalumnae TaxID=7897 RepID=UPI00313DA49A